MLVIIFLIGCGSKKYPVQIEANNQSNENKIDYKPLMDDIDHENYNQARDTIYNLKQQYSNDYMLNKISNQLESYVKAENNVQYDRDWETAISDLNIADDNDGSKKLIERAKDLKKRIDIKKITYDGHSNERERMF